MLDPVFLKDIQTPFDVRRFAYSRAPIEGFAFAPGKPGRVWSSRNHWMIKSQGSEQIILDDLEPDVRRFCQKALQHMEASRLPLKGRYLYLTVDDRIVPSGRSQRQSGWHFYGMQGSEVPTPNPGCFQYLWCDHTPMQISTQSFKTKGLDRHSVNLFDSLANQIDDNHVRQTRPGIAYLMSPYQLHRGTAVDQECRRKIIRLSASHQPITSVKMTINPHADYDYPVHTTSGDIPGGLKVLYTNEDQSYYRAAS